MAYRSLGFRGIMRYLYSCVSGASPPHSSLLRVETPAAQSILHTELKTHNKTKFQAEATLNTNQYQNWSQISNLLSIYHCKDFISLCWWLRHKEPQWVIFFFLFEMLASFIGSLELDEVWIRVCFLSDLHHHDSVEDWSGEETSTESSVCCESWPPLYYSVLLELLSAPLALIAVCSFLWPR